MTFDRHPGVFTYRKPCAGLLWVFFYPQPFASQAQCRSNGVMNEICVRGRLGQSGQDGRVFPGFVLCDDPAFDIITPMFLLHEGRLDKRWLGLG